MNLMQKYFYFWFTRLSVGRLVFVDKQKYFSNKNDDWLSQKESFLFFQDNVPDNLEHIQGGFYDQAEAMQREMQKV